MEETTHSASDRKASHPISAGLRCLDIAQPWGAQHLLGQSREWLLTFVNSPVTSKECLRQGMAASDLEEENLVCITTDNASNVKLAAEINGWTWLQYFGKDSTWQ